MADKTAHTIDSLAEMGRKLLHSTEHPPTAHRRFTAWDGDVADLMDSEFPNSGLSATWSSLPTSMLVIGKKYYTDTVSWSSFQMAVRTRLQFLAEVGTKMVKSKETLPGVDQPTDANSVFLVHGHDDAARESVARFVEQLGLRAIILHEQPNRGRTIIEKLEAHRLVGFALVLLTPDDVGGGQ